MSHVTTSLIALACLCGGALAGARLRVALPEHHLRDESRNIVLLGIGLVVTMSALVLGLLVSSAQGAFAAQRDEIVQISARVVWLDRVLAHYGPEAHDARLALRDVLTRTMVRVWSAEGAPPSSATETLYYRVQELSPGNDAQRSNRAEALGLASDLGRMRWLMFEQQQTSLPWPLLVVLVFWLTIVFTSFGLFAPTNSTVLVALFVSALSVAMALLLIQELYAPFSGLLEISSAPLRSALVQLGR
jgi:hypothetical protein